MSKSPLFQRVFYGIIVFANLIDKKSAPTLKNTVVHLGSLYLPLICSREGIFCMVDKMYHFFLKWRTGDFRGKLEGIKKQLLLFQK